MSQNYRAALETRDGVRTVRLFDSAGEMEAAIAPEIGNMAFELKLRGKNALWFPFESPAALKASPSLCGIPFLAPWANRLTDDAFWANGRRYALNAALNNLRRDANQTAIHGLLSFSPGWKLLDAGAGDDGAWCSSSLEFWRDPAMMAQFPFAHALTITYRLADGSLEVKTTVENLSSEPMPLAIGYHPYFRLHDSPRDAWKARIAARCRMPLDERLIPTGERSATRFEVPHPLADGPLDDVFTDLERGADGRAVFSVEGGREKVSVIYGSRYRVAVVFAPAGRDFICFEPMTAITNAFNLHHAGMYDELQHVPPGAQWVESFWIRPSGF